MADITERERMEASFRGEILDRIPVYMSSSVIEYTCGKLGYTRTEVLTDIEKELKALELSQKEFPSDVIRMPADPMLPTTAAARDEINPDRKPGHRPPPLQDKGRLAEFEIRDPWEDRLYRPYLDLVPRVKDRYPDHMVCSMCPGVWSTASGMRGAEQFIFDTADDPEFVHELVRFTTAMSKARAEALIKAGTDMLVFGDPNSGCSMISPKIYREFVKPYHEDLVTYLKSSFDVLVGFHICGFTDPIMEDIASYPLDWFEIDSPSSLEKMKQAANGRMTVRGNVATDLFFKGTEEEMREAVKACIDIGAPGGRYILAPGCATPWNAKPENLRAYFEAAYEYGAN